MTDFATRKAERTARHKAEAGRKLVTCGACAGSGHCDHTGSPPCAGCDGAGRVRECVPTAPTPPLHWRARLAQEVALKRARASRA